MERDKALEMALSQIEKQYGKGSVMRMSDKGEMNIEAIATGALALDLALGVGGLPRGRVVEIYGPESSGQVHARHARGGRGAAQRWHLRLHRRRARDGSGVRQGHRRRHRRAADLAARHRRAGARDHRHARALRCARRGGDRLGGCTHAPCRDRGRDGRHPRRPPGAPDVQALRKLTANLNRTNTICVFINQLREKIGVMFGCFSYDTRVTLADGTQEKIGKIVNQRLPVEVLSYDPDSGAVDRPARS